MVDQQFEDLYAVDCQGCRFIVRRCDYRPPNISAFMPYLLLSVMTFVVLAVKPINEMLGRFKIGIVVPETRTGYGIVNAAIDSYSPVAIFTQAGMFLFLAAIIALAYYKSKGWIKTGGIRNAFANSISMTMPSGMAVIGLVIMSKIMGGTGQTIVLSQGIANVLGSKYLLLAPFVGLLIEIGRASCRERV